MYNLYNNNPLLTQNTTVIKTIKECVQVHLEGHPYCMKGAQHNLGIFKIICCFDSTLKWFILGFILIGKNQPIHRTYLRGVKVRKCSLIYGFKYPF